MRLVLISIVLIAVATILLGVKVLFVKGGKFPSGHVHSSPALRDKGVTCPSSEATANKNHYNKHK